MQPGGCLAGSAEEASVGGTALASFFSKGKLDLDISCMGISRFGILDSVSLRLAVYGFFFSFSFVGAGYIGFLWTPIMASVFILTQ